MSLRRNMAWIGLSQAAFFVVQFGGSVAVARLLTPYQVGVYAIALAIVGALSTIQSFGLSGFIVREAELTEPLRRTVLAANAALSLLLSAGIFLGSLVAGNWFKEPGVTQVLRYLAILPLIDAVQFMPSAMLEREGRFKVIAIVNSARTLMTQVVTVAGAAFGYSYLSMAYGQIAASIVSVLLYNVLGRNHILIRPSKARMGHVLKFGVQMLLIGGVNNIAARLSEAVLGRFIGLAGLGLYSRASNINNLAWENIHSVAGRVLFVELAERKRSGGDIRPVYLAIVESLTTLLWPAFAGLAIVSGPFIALIYGQRWVGAAHPLIMLSIAAILLVAIAMTWELFVITERTGTQARLEVVRTGVGLAFFTGGALIGLTAAAAARVVEAAFSVWLYRPHLDKMSGTHTRDLIPIYTRSALFTALAVAPAAGVMAAHGASEHTPILEVVAAIGLGVVLWAATLWRFDHPLTAEARRLLARFRARKLAPSLP